MAKNLSTKELSQLSQCGQLGRKIPKGSQVFRQADPADNVFSVRTGALKTFRLSEGGQQQITGFRLAGSTVGLVDMAEATRSEYAEAVEDSVVCSFSGSRLKRLMAVSPTLMNNFIQQCGDQIREQQDNAKDGDATERALHFFTELQTGISRPGVCVSGFTLPMSNKDIANYLRLRPETLSRVFHQLKVSGRLSLKGRTVLSFSDEPQAREAQEYHLAS
jgi:CRP/FNR family transcriptional regulator